MKSLNATESLRTRTRAGKPRCMLRREEPYIATSGVVQPVSTVNNEYAETACKFENNIHAIPFQKFLAWHKLLLRSN